MNRGAAILLDILWGMGQEISACSSRLGTIDVAVWEG